MDQELHPQQHGRKSPPLPQQRVEARQLQHQSYVPRVEVAVVEVHHRIIGRRPREEGQDRDLRDGAVLEEMERDLVDHYRECKGTPEAGHKERPLDTEPLTRPSGQVVEQAH